MNESKNLFSMSRVRDLDDELSLLELMSYVKRNLSILLVSIFLGALGGWCIAFFSPAQWEASALVKVGQFENAESPIEHPLQIVDRFKSRAFQKDILLRLGLPLQDGNAEMFYDTFRVTLEKSNLIRLKLRGISSNVAQKEMSLIVKQLKNHHSDIIDSSIKLRKQELELIDVDLKYSVNEVERIRKYLDSPSLRVERDFYQVALMSSTLIGREGLVQILRERHNLLEYQLSGMRTFYTDTLGEVATSASSVYPQKHLLVFAGLFAGVLLGLVILVLKYRLDEKLKCQV